MSSRSIASAITACTCAWLSSCREQAAVRAIAAGATATATQPEGFDLSSGARLWTIDLPSAPLAFSLSGDGLVAAAAVVEHGDLAVHAWRTDSGKPAGSIPKLHGRGVLGLRLAISWHGQVIAIARSDLASTQRSGR